MLSNLPKFNSKSQEVIDLGFECLSKTHVLNHLTIVCNLMCCYINVCCLNFVLAINRINIFPHGE